MPANRQPLEKFHPIVGSGDVDAPNITASGLIDEPNASREIACNICCGT